jgi:hypothetical protein
MWKGETCLWTSSYAFSGRLATPPRCLIPGRAKYSFGRNKNPTNPFPVAKVREVEITLPNRQRHDVDHVWLQHTETLRDVVQPGSRFMCDCTVKRRARWGRMDDGF